MTNGSLLQLAVKAALPMIAVTTSDLVNLEAVVEHLTGRTVLSNIEPKSIPEGALFVGPENLEMPVSMFGKMVAAGATYIGVNFKTVPKHFFDAGEVPTPAEMIDDLLTKVLKDPALVASIMPTLGGLTIKDAVELVRITMARDGSLTAAGVGLSRRAIFRLTRGMTLLDTEGHDYVPPKALSAFVEREKAYFLKGTDHRLMPRGLLFDGPRGTGKTAGAKYIAQKFGVPLFRIDLGTVQEKWVGSSEEHMARALARLTEAAPCVALFDEVEKMLSGYASDSTGIGGKMLAQLLWWLQEHRSRVFTVMTTNDIKRIPPEVYREGRIDEVMTFNGLVTQAEVAHFAKHVMEQFPEVLHIKGPVVDFKKLPVSQAAVTTAVYKAIKSKAHASAN